MATIMENVLCDENIDAILTVIENDVVATDASFNATMVELLISREESPLPVGLQYDLRSRVYKSKDYQVDLDDSIYSYNFIKDVITDFLGDGEKFCPTFYKAVSEGLFKELK